VVVYSVGIGATVVVVMVPVTPLAPETPLTPVASEASAERSNVPVADLKS
jgi:hypothetical protein